MQGEPKGNDTDLVFRIRGLYRLLDLISEQGSGEAGRVNVPSCYISRLNPRSFPRGQDHHRSRVRGEVCERHLSRCLYLRDKGD